MCYGLEPMPQPAKARRAQPAKARRAKPVIGLLAAEEPPDRKKLHRARSVVDQIAELIPALKEQSGTWIRVADLPARSSAQSAVRRLRATHPDVEWRAVAWPDRSSVYARTK